LFTGQKLFLNQNLDLKKDSKKFEKRVAFLQEWCYNAQAVERSTR